jgi:hypothetical protein
VLATSALAALAVATSAHAGSTGPLMPILRARSAPVIDGLGDLVWGDVAPIHFGEDIYANSLSALHDGRTLYLLIQEPTAATVDCDDRFVVSFEDEPGPAPRLWNDVFDAGSCLGLANAGEGRLETNCFGEQHVFLQHLADGSTCGGFAQASGVVAAIVQDHPIAGGVTAEIAIPLDGVTALHAGPGDQFGVFFEIFDDYGPGIFRSGIWPPEQSATPEWWANATLATLGCNAPAEDFDPSFGADWQRTQTAGTVEWKLSGGGDGCGVANVTGGAGLAACLARTGTQAVAALLTSETVSLVGAVAGALRFRGNYQHATKTGFGVQASDDGGANWSTTLLQWQEDHGDASGPGEEVALPLPPGLLGQPDVRFRFVFGAATGSPASFAQVDDVELVCDPDLFGDGFETALTTHWSITTPYP